MFPLVTFALLVAYSAPPYSYGYSQSADGSAEFVASVPLTVKQAAPLVIASSDGHYTWTVATSRLTCSAFADPHAAYALKCIPKLP